MFPDPRLQSFLTPFVVVDPFSSAILNHLGILLAALAIQYIADGAKGLWT